MEGMMRGDFNGVNKMAGIAKTGVIILMSCDEICFAKSIQQDVF
jgi:hypothetical protein